jgi:hypothetical protein
MPDLAIAAIALFWVVGLVRLVPKAIREIREARRVLSNRWDETQPRPGRRSPRK